MFLAMLITLNRLRDRIYCNSEFDENLCVNGLYGSVYERQGTRWIKLMSRAVVFHSHRQLVSLISNRLYKSGLFRVFLNFFSEFCYRHIC